MTARPTIDARLKAVEAALVEALRLTGCTDPDNNRRDRMLRDRMAWLESPDGMAFDATQREMAEWFRREKANKVEARQRLGDWAARLGLSVTVVTVVGGMLSGAAAGAIWLIRSVTGGVP